MKVTERQIANNEIFMLTSSVKLENSVIQTLRLVRQLTMKIFGKPWGISVPTSQTILKQLL